MTAPTLESIDEKLDSFITEFRQHKKEVESAFCRDDLGNCDFSGHRAFHLECQKRAAALETRRGKLIESAVTGGMMSSLAFVLLATWDRIVEFIAKGH